MVEEIWQKQTDKGTVIIRLAKGDDLRGITRVKEEFYAKHGIKQETKERADYYSERIKEGKILVATTDDGVVGFTDYAQLTIVRDAFQNLKIGQVLLALIVKYMTPGKHGVLILALRQGDVDKVMKMINKLKARGIIEIEIPGSSFFGSGVWEEVKLVVSANKERTATMVDMFLSEDLKWQKIS